MLWVALPHCKPNPRRVFKKLSVSANNIPYKVYITGSLETPEFSRRISRELARNSLPHPDHCIVARQSHYTQKRTQREYWSTTHGGKRGRKYYNCFSQTYIVRTSTIINSNIELITFIMNDNLLNFDGHLLKSYFNIFSPRPRRYTLRQAMNFIYMK